MKLDLEHVLKGKRAFRRELATRPISEKLRMLDALRERAITIRRASNAEPVRKAAARDSSG
jgi:hypothetical protein